MPLSSITFNWLHHRLWLPILLMCGLLPVFFINWNLPPGLLVKHLQNFLHLPSFAFLYIALRWGLRPKFQRRTDLFLAAALLVFGGLIELIQPLFGRSRSLADFLLDGGGILCGFILWRVYCGQLARSWLLLCGLVLLAGLAPAVYWHHAEKQRVELFPTLLDFDTSALTAFIGVVSKAELKVETAPEAWQSNTSRVGRLDVEPAGWPGFYLGPPVKDWSDLHYIELELFSPHSQPVAFAVRVDDAAYRGGGDNFDRAYTLKPGLNPLRIPLSEVRDAPAERQMNLAEIRHIFLYVRRPEKPVTLYLDNIRLTE